VLAAQFFSEISHHSLIKGKGNKMPSYKLLTIGNTKLLKNGDYGFYSPILHLAPYKVSGFQVCKFASKGCASTMRYNLQTKKTEIVGGCLMTSGRGGYDKGVETNKIHKARVRRTRLFFENRTEFFKLLVKDIKKAKNFAAELGQELTIRLNGTSDLPWESMGFEDENGVYWNNLMQMFPTTIFYDYTKYPIRLRKNLPINYHLTYSLSETLESYKEASVSLSQGRNVAVVMRLKPSEDFPKTFWGIRVVDGDKNDLRPLDPSPCIVGLRAKGTLRRDFENKFVHNPHEVSLDLIRRLAEAA